MAWEEQYEAFVLQKGGQEHVLQNSPLSCVFPNRVQPNLDIIIGYFEACLQPVAPKPIGWEVLTPLFTLPINSNEALLLQYRDHVLCPRSQGNLPYESGLA